MRHAYWWVLVGVVTLAQRAEGQTKLENPSHSANIASLNNLAVAIKDQTTLSRAREPGAITAALKELVYASGREQKKEVYDFLRALNIVEYITGIDAKDRKKLYDALFKVKFSADLLANARTWDILLFQIEGYKEKPIEPVKFSTSQQTAKLVRDGVNKIITAFNQFVTVLQVRAQMELFAKALENLQKGISTYNDETKLKKAIDQIYKERSKPLVALLVELKEPEDIREPLRAINIALVKLSGQMAAANLANMAPLRQLTKTSSKISASQAVNKIISAFNGLLPVLKTRLGVK